MRNSQTLSTAYYEKAVILPRCMTQVITSTNKTIKQYKNSTKQYNLETTKNGVKAVRGYIQCSMLNR